MEKPKRKYVNAYELQTKQQIAHKMKEEISAFGD